jgi:hypothetical protein
MTEDQLNGGGKGTGKMITVDETLVENLVRRPGRVYSETISEIFLCRYAILQRIGDQEFNKLMTTLWHILLIFVMEWKY